MSCDFCRSTPVDPCPVCAPADHAGNTRIRRAPKLPKALRAAVADVKPPDFTSGERAAWEARQTGPLPGVNSRARYTPPPAPPLSPSDRAAVDAIKARMMGTVPPVYAGPARQALIAANEQRIRELEARLAASKAAGVASVRVVPPTRANPTPPPPIVAQRPVQAARVAKVTPISNWEELGNLAREWMRSKRRPQLVDSTAKVVPTRDEEATHPPITRGDFKGLWVAVESGLLTEADAIEIAASWRSAAGVAS